MMRELYRTKSEGLRAVQSNLLFIGAAELLIYNGGLFQGTMNYGSGFYQETYGYEGSITAAILAGVMILWLIDRLRKKGEL